MMPTYHVTIPVQVFLTAPTREAVTLAAALAQPFTYGEPIIEFEETE